MQSKKRKKGNKLLVPKRVSVGLAARTQSPGTKAFVEKGTRLPRGLRSLDKFKALRKLAKESNYFIKPLSARNKRIRRVLEENGIRVEKVIEDLKDGTALFEKEGFTLYSSRGKRIFSRSPKKFVKKIQELVAKMHSLGISHNHLHGANMAITQNGEIVLLDLGRATIAKSTRPSDLSRGPNRFVRDMKNIATGIGNIYPRLSEEKKRWLIVGLVWEMKQMEQKMGITI